MSNRWMVGAVPLLMSIGLLGCSSDATPIDCGPKPHPVSGTVTFKGKPMGGAIVTFYPMTTGEKFAAAPSATADADGKYRLTTYFSGDGAPAGEYRVTIYWPGKRRGLPNDDGDLPPDQLKEVYANKATSKLRAKVAAQENTIDFALPTP
ncbi:hypothetical protein [Tuwongella immobilis]|uniref:Carboxypeptidase regulatory-like domain-containing protein n=1 Tax=Tuwongella immobilis TaxID=692036 RepID=A0A6C2YTP4_9BACT|nr:hypothetical protein [Tuwongella immobilis]VIP04493.1 Uncharacterized protein OS=Singulisphaera acidiphila (strain ATCC BAA-1392 / DSM 18658 / VKM B-2454 / MOB10) GN=Sinac_3752 PE=4 SV=1 [Tuwongella immobilis]VTS06348.1 Uncharacterized protein OS=Singulisphaera acidiphila (strain ATCC BAA-1392 / DSM 18658 / VKM B-2454 / MOB10) GN=Sinac_3752 PE=4 SV=1 [Tuwongella immobilis]